MNEFDSIAREIRTLALEWTPILSALSEEVLTQSKNSQDRSIKQIVGHIVDSASNNTHRIVHLQYQKLPLDFPNYATYGNNDRWIAIQDYQNEDLTELIQLMKYSLLHVCHVIKKVSPQNLNNEWISGPGKQVNLKDMIIDFPRHLKLHLTEIKDLIDKN